MSVPPGRKACFLAAALLASCSSSSPPTYSAAIQEGQDAAYEALRLGDVTSLGIALVTRDRLVWAESFGLADVAAQAAPTAGTMFGIGSVSKMFAAVAVMQLVEEGKLELDEPVVTYLPSFRMADPRYRDVTVRMLLDHASGIPGTTFRDGFTSSAVLDYPEQVLEALSLEPLKAAPGAMSVYCNDGFTLVESLVAAVSGRTYAAYVKARILDPLGMAHSAFPLAPFADGAYAKVYRAGVLQPQEYTNLLASGGLYSTPTDLGAFARAFLNQGGSGQGRILSPASVQEMAVDQTLGTLDPAPSRTMAYGLGWDSVTEPALLAVGAVGWAKEGGSFLYGAKIIVAPGEGIAVAVMGTSGTGYDPTAIAQRVLLRALAETGRIPSFPAPAPPVAAPEAPVPGGLLASVAGVYGAYNALVAFRPEEDGSLTMLTWDGEGFTPTEPGLRYRSDGWFTADAAPLRSRRFLEADGRQYVAIREPWGDRSYLDQMVEAQRIRGRDGPLGGPWPGRMGRTWLVANESPDSQLLLLGNPPDFTMTQVPELPGLVVAVASLLPRPQVLDPAGDNVARMMLVIPANNGRDLNELQVVNRSGEEWIRWGNYLNRPLDTVPVLPAGATTPVAIGPEGYAEWRVVQGGPVPVTAHVSGARAWRAYDAEFRPAGSGGASGQVVVPEGAPLAYLMLYGAPGGSVGVSVD